MNLLKNWQYASISLGIGVGAFLIGMVTGSFNAKPVEKTVVAPIPTVTVVKDTTNEDNWKKLKLVDDKAIDVCGQGFNIVSNIFDAQTRQDSNAVNVYVADLESKAKDMQVVAQQRVDALKAVGY